MFPSDTQLKKAPPRKQHYTLHFNLYFEEIITTLPNIIGDVHFVVIDHHDMIKTN